ncbi:hypothetical protein DRQ33_08120 [bacterium]|nr:MAG: hypothetical protein DRQ33_08120 [bacterium]
MSDNNSIDVLKEKLGEKIRDIAQPRKRRVYLIVDRNDIQDAARIIFYDLGYRLCTATGIDVKNGVEIIYHFYHDEKRMMVNLKTVAPKPDLVTKSVAAVFKAAEWIEREIAELFGVTFEGHPDPRKLLLADDWPEGLYPLRTDYPQKKVDGFEPQDVDEPHPDATHIL